MEEEEKFEIARKACKVLNKNHKDCFVVGGSVRDMLLGLPIKDVDITTNARPEEVMEIFKRENIKVVPTGLKHGTISVIIDKEPVEITTYRKDARYSDFRHPDEVTFSKTLEEDLKRRDFTINALALNPMTEELVDLHGGKQDIVDKIIRAVGDPQQRFREDALRMYRACRFSSKLGFDIDENVEKAIKNNKDLARRLSAERIRDELLSTLESDKPSLGIDCMVDNGLFDHILPEVLAMQGVLQPQKYHVSDVYDHSLAVMDHVPKDKPLVRLAGLFHDIGKPSTMSGEGEARHFLEHEDVGAEMFKQVGERLKLSGEEIDHVVNLIENHLIMYDDKWTDGAVRRFVNRVGEESLEDLFLLNEADIRARGKEPVMLEKLKQRIQDMQREKKPTTFTRKDLKISGRDVMRVLNIEPSIKIGKVLNTITEQVIDDPSLNDRTILLKMIKTFKEGIK